ncbi:MAG: hypothetical protein E4G89_01200 [Methanothrix sp.]|nr:MAG: hypothetical protein E4G89_01200 [Methanothrix sp.]
MSKLHTTNDSRTNYDEKTGVVRSFFGAELVEPMPEAKRALAPIAKSDDFLEVNRDLFNLGNITLRMAEESGGAVSISVRYEQQHHGIPVYGAQLVVGLRKEDSTVTSAVNAVDYEIPTDLTPDRVTVSGDQAEIAVREKFASRFADLEIGKPTLYVYRHVADESFDLDLPLPAIRREMLDMSTGKPGQVYLVWQVPMRTEGPSGSWELLVDATNGELVAVKDKRRYAAPKADIFWPDPIRSKKDDSLSWSTSESDLNNQLVKNVPLEDLDPAVSGKYKLDGKWVRSRDRSKPDFSPPETTGDFKYGAKSKEFLSVMAYYYLVRLITDLRSFGITSFNNAVTGPIDADAQGADGDNNSFFDPGADPVYITFGTNETNPDTGTALFGVPDAQDPGVIVHEYGHAIHYFLNKEQSYAHEHWFCDFLAVAWVDRYNKHQYLREEMFPWDNNSGDEWSNIRRVDLIQRFDDPGFSAYKATLQGAIGATALWDWFNNIGGASSNADVRKWAADEAIRTYIEMLTFTASNTTHENLVKGLITADTNKKLTGGLYGKVIWDAFRHRGLWSNFSSLGNVDVYIDDGRHGEYEYREVFWENEDIWNRHNPDGGTSDETPCMNILNHVYVRVKNRGSETAQNVVVRGFHCKLSPNVVWPDSWNPLITPELSPPGKTISPGDSVVVGPFKWRPQSSQECLLMYVSADGDRSNADPTSNCPCANGPTPSDLLVRFDNNIGQRNVSVHPSDRKVSTGDFR